MLVSSKDFWALVAALGVSLVMMVLLVASCQQTGTRPSEKRGVEATVHSPPPAEEALAMRAAPQVGKEGKKVESPRAVTHEELKLAAAAELELRRRKAAESKVVIPSAAPATPAPVVLNETTSGSPVVSDLSGNVLLRELIARLERIEARLDVVEKNSDAKIETLRRSTQDALNLVAEHLPDSTPNRKIPAPTLATPDIPSWNLFDQRKAAWRSLNSRMQTQDVRRILGEPAATRSSTGFEYWTFSDGGTAVFYKNRLNGWNAP